MGALTCDSCGTEHDDGPDDRRGKSYCRNCGAAMEDTPAEIRRHALTTKDAELAALRERFAEEEAIVSRIWVQLGSPSYEELAGRSIYDLIDELKAELAAERARVGELEGALRAITDQCEAEFMLDGKWVDDGQLVTRRAYNKARAALPPRQGEG